MSFSEVFAELKKFLEPYADRLAVVSDTEGNYYLDTFHIMKNKKPLFFGAAQIKKRYVSFHLMPVYVEPALLDGMSEPLKKRMQGKSCFNFRAVDAVLFSELSELTRRGFEFYEEKGYVEAG